MITSQKKKTLWLCPFCKKEKSPFLSAGTEPCWDIWLHLLYHLPAVLSQGWEKFYSAVSWPEDKENRSL